MQRQPEIVIRNARPDDAAALNAIMTDPRVMNTLVMMPTMPLSQTADYLAKTVPGKHHFVAEVGGEIAGSGSLTHTLRPRMQHSGRLGLYVAHRFWGMGVGTALLARMVDLADNWLGLQRVQLEVLADNRGAVRLYEKVGFEIEALSKEVVFGGDGRFHDEYVMSRIPPGAPRATPRQPAAMPDHGRDDVVKMHIRPPRPEDAEDLYAMFRDPLVARGTLQMPSQEISLTYKRLEETNPRLFRFVAEATHEDGSRTVCGMATLYQLEHERLMHAAGLGMSVTPAYWGLRVGSRLLAALLDLADNWLNLRRVFLEVNTDNPAAIRLYENQGFKREGTLRLHTFGEGVYIDSYLMGRLREL